MKSSILNDKDLKTIKKDIDKYISETFIDTSIKKRVLEQKEVFYECTRAVPSLESRKSFIEALKNKELSFQERMFKYLDDKKLDEVEVYNKAHIDRRLFSKIRSDKDFKPSRKTAISLCIGLELNLEETNDLLEKAGYTLSHSSVADIIIEYFINKKIYDLFTINQTLLDYKMPPLYA